jgi:hypothetical protein
MLALRNTALSRLIHLRAHFPIVDAPVVREITTTSSLPVAKMSTLSINIKYRMPSGYESPALVYGVYQTPAAECVRILVML